MRAQAAPEREADGGEHDVVERAAERVLDRLEAGEVGVDPGVAAVRADVDVQRRGGRGRVDPRQRGGADVREPLAQLPQRARGRRTTRRAPRAISPGTVVRSSSASPSSLAEPGSGRGLHGPGGARRRADRLGGGVEQHGGDVHARDPVHERVVGLGDQREAPSRHPLDQPDLPQRLGAVQALGEEPPREPLQRCVVARPWQRGVADVVVRVEVGVVGPHRAPLIERHVRQALAVARHEVQAALHVLDELLRRRRTAFEDHHRRHVHVRGGVILQVQEGGVEAGEAVGVCHSA